MRPRTAAFSADDTGCGFSGPSTRANAASARETENSAPLGVASNRLCGLPAHRQRNQMPTASRPKIHARAIAIAVPPSPVSHAKAPLAGLPAFALASSAAREKPASMRLSAPFPVLFFASAAHGMHHILLTLYLTLVLVLSPAWHLPYNDLIALWTLGAMLVGLGAPLAGLLADRIGETKVLVLCFLGLGTSSILCGLAQNTWQLEAALALLGLSGSIYHPVGFSWVVKHASARGRAIGRQDLDGAGPDRGRRTCLAVELARRLHASGRNHHRAWRGAARLPSCGTHSRSRRGSRAAVAHAFARRHDARLCGDGLHHDRHARRLLRVRHRAAQAGAGEHRRRPRRPLRRRADRRRHSAARRLGAVRGRTSRRSRPSQAHLSVRLPRARGRLPIGRLHARLGRGGRRHRRRVPLRIRRACGDDVPRPLHAGSAARTGVRRALRSGDGGNAARRLAGGAALQSGGAVHLPVDDPRRAVAGSPCRRLFPAVRSRAPSRGNALTERRASRLTAASPRHKVPASSRVGRANQNEEGKNAQESRVIAGSVAYRSEERRVGKECRSRWS